MFEITEYIGIIAFAMSGFFVGIRSKLDILGVLISVFLTAFGGGVIRDVLVDETPYSFQHDMPLVIVVSIMLLLVLFKFHTKQNIENKPFFILSDSIGLVSFSITGAMIGLEHHLNLMGVLSLAFITAVGGGISRDVIINEVPFVFKTGFYGTVALLVGLLIFVFHYFGFVGGYSMGFIFVLGVAIRVIAYYKKWTIHI